MEALFFVGNQLIATSHTGRIGVWNAVTKHWQVRVLALPFPGVQTAQPSRVDLLSAPPHLNRASKLSSGPEAGPVCLRPKEHQGGLPGGGTAKLTGTMDGFGKERGFCRCWMGEQVRGDGVGDRNPGRHMQTSVIHSASTPSHVPNVRKAHLQCCFLLLKYECLRERQTNKQREEGGRDRQRGRDRKVERGDREEPGLNVW